MTDHPRVRALALRLLRGRFPTTFPTARFARLPIALRAQWLYELVYAARFELVSHFIFGPFSSYMKGGEEFLEGLAQGMGGVCLERVMGLELLLRSFEIGECSYAMGGSLPGARNPIDAEEVRGSLATPDRMKHSKHAHHAAVIVRMQGEEWLLDPNAGRFGKIFLSPSVTRAMLEAAPERKFGMEASFGQMFYHRVPADLFEAMIAANRADAMNALGLICLVGLIVGPDFDLFLIPEAEFDRRLPKLYPRRVQTMIHRVEGRIPAILKRFGLAYAPWPGRDPFRAKLDDGVRILRRLSTTPGGPGELALVLRVAERPWSDFTQPGPPLPEDLLMT